MFLIELWNSNIRGSGPNYKISDQYLALETAWVHGLIDISGINYAVDTPHGGMISASYGTISFLPTVDCDDYVGVRISYTASDEASAVVLYNGVAFINSRTRTVLTFDLFSDVPTVIIDPALNYNDGSYPGAGGTDNNWTMPRVFQSYCDSITPDPDPWTLDSTLADNAHVSFTAESGQLFADMLRSMCKSFAHYFVVDYTDKIIYLRRVTEGAGSITTVTPFEFAPSRYSYTIPAAKVTVDDYTAYGAPHYYGNTIALESFGSNDEDTYADHVIDLYTLWPQKFELFIPMEYFAAKGINFVTNNIVTWTEDTVVFADGLPSEVFKMVVLGVSFNVSSDQAILSGRVIA